MAVLAVAARSVVALIFFRARHDGFDRLLSRRLRLLGHPVASRYRPLEECDTLCIESTIALPSSDYFDFRVFQRLRLLGESGFDSIRPRA